MINLIVKFRENDIIWADEPIYFSIIFHFVKDIFFLNYSSLDLPFPEKNIIPRMAIENFLSQAESSIFINFEELKNNPKKIFSLLNIEGYIEKFKLNSISLHEEKSRLLAAILYSFLEQRCDIFRKNDFSYLIGQRALFQSWPNYFDIYERLDLQTLSEEQVLIRAFLLKIRDENHFLNQELEKNHEYASVWESGFFKLNQRLYVDYCYSKMREVYATFFTESNPISDIPIVKESASYYEDYIKDFFSGEFNLVRLQNCIRDWDYELPRDNKNEFHAHFMRTFLMPTCRERAVIIFDEFFEDIPISPEEERQLKSGYIKSSENLFVENCDLDELLNSDNLNLLPKDFDGFDDFFKKKLLALFDEQTIMRERISDLLKNNNNGLDLPEISQINIHTAKNKGLIHYVLKPIQNLFFFDDKRHTPMRQKIKHIFYFHRALVNLQKFLSDSDAYEIKSLKVASEKKKIYSFKKKKEPQTVFIVSAYLVSDEGIIDQVDFFNSFMHCLLEEQTCIFLAEFPSIVKSLVLAIELYFGGICEESASLAKRDWKTIFSIANPYLADINQQLGANNFFDAKNFILSIEMLRFFLQADDVLAKYAKKNLYKNFFSDQSIGVLLKKHIDLFSFSYSEYFLNRKIEQAEDDSEKKSLIAFKRLSKFHPDLYTLDDFHHQLQEEKPNNKNFSPSFLILLKALETNLLSHLEFHIMQGIELNLHEGFHPRLLQDNVFPKPILLRLKYFIFPRFALPDFNIENIKPADGPWKYNSKVHIYLLRLEALLFFKLHFYSKIYEKNSDGILEIAKLFQILFVSFIKLEELLELRKKFDEFLKSYERDCKNLPKHKQAELEEIKILFQNTTWALAVYSEGASATDSVSRSSLGGFFGKSVKKRSEKNKEKLDPNPSSSLPYRNVSGEMRPITYKFSVN